jgi:sulfatase modifying factor 1
MRCFALASLLLLGAACSDDPTRISDRFDRLHPPVVALPDARADVDNPADSAEEDGNTTDIADADDVAEPSDMTQDIFDDAVVPTDAEADLSITDVITTDVSEPSTCTIGNRTGTCTHVADCAAPLQAVEGFCGPNPLQRCCIAAEDRCSRQGVPGACFTSNDCGTNGFTTDSGLCPGATDIRCCYPTDRTNTCEDGDLPVPTPVLVEEPGDPGCPAGMARLATFCIDRFEAALVDGQGGALTPFARPASNAAIRAVSAAYAVPQGYIDGVSAGRACAAAGKRLCTTNEWLLACRGAENRTYPYGNTRIAGRCNDARRRHPAVEYFNSNESWVWSSLDHPCISQLPDSLHLTGENAGCVTPEGVFDLMGNLHEWVDDPEGTFRGGFYADTAINGEGCLYRTTAHGITHSDYSTGFRCCADILP